MARKQWDIHVLDEDFEHGIPKDSYRCAVKRAVARDIPGATRVEVDLQTVRFSLEGERHVFLTPWQVAEYVIAFDAGDDDAMQPFAFRLRQAVEIGSQVRRKAFTDEGKKVDAARNRVRKAQAKKERAVEALANPEASAVQRAQAEETLDTIDTVIAERQRNYEDVRASAKEEGKKLEVTVARDKPRAPRRHKTRTRNFGMRVLRVNQAEGRMHVT